MPSHLRSTRIWIYGLLSSVISGAAGSVAVMFVDPKDFNLGDGLPKLAQVFVASGIIALINYLAKHPLPEWDGTTERRDDPDSKG